MFDGFSDGFESEDFSVEMGSFEMKQVRDFDRVFRVGDGGSFSQKPLIHEGIVYVGSMDHHVYAIDAVNGALVWKFRAEGGFFLSSPVISEGIIYIGSYDHNMYALDAETGKLAWKFRTSDKVMECACIHGDKIYFGSNDHNLYCLNKETGRLLWKFRTQGEVASTPSVHNSRLLFGSYDRFLYCLSAETGILLWKHETQGNVFNSPPLLIHDGRVYFPSFDNYLRVVDAETGRLIWKFLTGQYGGMGCSPVLYGGILYQHNREGTIHALTMDGRKLWTFRINHTMGNPVVHEGRIYVGCGDHNLRCISLDGRELWKFPAQDEVWWSPAVCEGKVYFTSMDCNLYCVDVNTQNLMWKFRSRGSPSQWPPPFDTHELSVPIHDEEKPQERKKSYDLNVTGEEEEFNAAYKSRITYQVSTQYASRGKYQKDSDEEEF